MMNMQMVLKKKNTKTYLFGFLCNVLWFSLFTGNDGGLDRGSSGGD